MTSYETAAVEQLQRHCDALNSMGWVRASGKPYIVAKRKFDGREIHFVDRAN